MTRRDAFLLRAFAAWTVFVWGVLIRNMLRDRTHTFGFRAVHVGLAVVPIAFAAGAWSVTSRARRR